MNIALKTAGHVNALNTAELLIRRSIDREDASPFLAHCPFTQTDRIRFAASLKHFLQGDAGLLPEAFRRWPLATVWAFAQALSEFYGEDGHAVYAVLERTFAVDMEGDVRSEISDAFRSTCRRYGLCYAGLGRFVDDYLAQAGIANTQLHLLAKAFLAAERAFGPNRWGLCEMHGNAAEWCADHWHSTYSGAPADGSAWIEASADTSSMRVFRGGCWNHHARYVRSASRNAHFPAEPTPSVGFRCACFQD